MRQRISQRLHNEVVHLQATVVSSPTEEQPGRPAVGGQAVGGEGIGMPAGIHAPGDREQGCRTVHVVGVDYKLQLEGTEGVELRMGGFGLHPHIE